MGDKNVMIGAWGVVCACDLIVVIFAIIVLVINSSAQDNAGIDLTVVDQIKEDWGTQPYTSITVRTNQDCKFDEEVAFSWTYEGTVDGCDRGDYVETRAAFARRKQKRKGRCNVVESIDSASLTHINGVTVCGKRGGLPFYQVTRPDASTKQCPAGTAPCSSKTSAENTLCYPAQDLPASCPITGAYFFKENSNELSNFEYTNTTQGNWTKQTAYPGYVLYTTSDAIDTLPLMKSDMTFKPCMHPASKETNPANKFYNLERQQEEQCELEPNTQQKYDSRYNNLGLELDQYSLLRETGVWSQLNNLPYFKEQVPNAIAVKQASTNSLWGRPTIPYKLSCESNQTREAYFVKLAANPGEDLTALQKISGFGITLLVLTIFCGIFGVCGLMIPGAMGNIVTAIYVLAKAGCQIGFGVGILQNMLLVKSVLLDGQYRLDTASLINGCSDSFTNIDTALYQNKIALVEQTMGSMPGLTITMFVGICLSVLCLVGTCFLKMTSG